MNQHINTEAKSTPSALLRALKPALILLSIVVASVLVLALVNRFTANTIAQHTEEKQHAAMASVMPGANVFSEMYCEDTTVDRISGAYAGTTFLGYCVEVTSNGFGGAVRLMIGVDPNGSITGVSILDHSETADVGANASGSDFLDQYIGKSGSITVNTGLNAVQAVTGATITSKVVTQAVNTALTAVLNYDSEGGLNSEEHG